MFETIALIGLCFAFFALWRHEKRLHAALRKARQEEPQEAEKEEPYDPTQAPEEDEWIVRQLRLMELAWLGFEQAHACMDGDIAPHSRSQLEALRSGSAARWDACKRVNAYLRDITLEEWNEDEYEDIEDDWMERCEEHLGRKVPVKILRPILKLGDETRMALFDGVCDRHNTFVRLAKGDMTALSFGPVELVAYLRDIGIPEDRVTEEFRRHPDVCKTTASLDEEVSRFQADERMRQAVEREIGDELVHLKAVVAALPSQARAQAQERVDALEARILELRSKAAADRVRVKLDEVEIAVETEAEVAEALGQTRTR